MNFRLAGIWSLITVMLFSPTVIGLLTGGQAKNSSEDGFDKSNLTSKSTEIYICSTGKIEELNFEEYICGVLMAEVPSTFENEALKAMAVAVRSYCLRRMESEEKYFMHYSADVCDDYSHCLGYISLESAYKRWGEEAADKSYNIIKNAVDSTKGEVLYYNGTVIDAVFHSNSYGYTESAENIWGFEIPYLISVPTMESAVTSKKEFTADEFREVLDNAGVSCEYGDRPDEWIESVIKNSKNRVQEVWIGNNIITGRRVREIFGINSTCFDLSYKDEKFVFDVKGNGHGVGMSQYGCDAMAKEGKKYTDILSHYYRNTELGLY